MKIVYSPDHLLHSPEFEFYEGHAEGYAEVPQRIENIRDALDAEGYEIIPPRDFSDSIVNSVHFKRYVDFLELQSGSVSDSQEEDQRTSSNYIMDTYTPVTGGTYRAARSAANVALTATQEVVEGNQAYGLCRPPGHHAMKQTMGGYCYFNNAAIAAAELAKESRVAILDIDFHHGNGTQEIFYDRDDVLYVSLHADPDDHFPYSSGRTDEIGVGAGEGFNLNIPLQKGTDLGAYMDSLGEGLARIQNYSPDYAVLSLGFDTYRKDPIAGGPYEFKLDVDDYAEIGEAVHSLDLPTVLIQEGGYCVDDLGKLSLSFLSGFQITR